MYFAFTFLFSLVIIGRGPAQSRRIFKFRLQNYPYARPEGPLRLQQFEAARIFRHEGGKVVSPTQRPPFTPPPPKEDIPSTHFC